MGKKKNKGKKAQKEQQKKLLNMSCEELIEKADHALLSGNSRKAVKLFKSALKKVKEPEQKEKIKYSLFESYIAREKELRNKNMAAEAETVLKQAMAYMPDFSQTTEDFLISFLDCCENYQGLKAYSEFLGKNNNSIKIERILAEKVALDNCWNMLDDFKNLSFFRKDSDIIKNAIAIMNRGNWEEAQEIMRPLPRSSCFIHIRMFCRAMTSFYGDNDKDMVKALSMIGKTSIFNDIADILKANVKFNEEKKNRKETSNRIKGKDSLLKLLFTEELAVCDEVEALLKQLKQNQNSPKSVKLISKLAHLIYPESPDIAKAYILEIIWTSDLFYNNYNAPKNYFNMAQKLINQKTDYLKIKIDLMISNNVFVNAGKFIELAENEFSDSQERSIAKSMVIQRVASFYYQNKEPGQLSDVNIKTKKLLGTKSSHRETALLEMAYQGVKIDPHNRELFELAADFSCHLRASKKAKENIFLLMCESFSDDPYPYLELASVYHQKNAYRKAENILKKAMELAPHDIRVLDKHVISLIISADRNLNKNKFHLVWKDIEKAENLNSKNNELLLNEKKLFYKICEKPEMPLKILNLKMPLKILNLKLDDFSNFERIKILALMILDIGERKLSDKKKIEKKIKSLFNKEKVKELTSSEVLNLLMPLPRNWQNIFPNQDMASLFLGKFKKLLNLLDNTDLFNLIDQILRPDLYDYFLKTLYHRVNVLEDNGEERDLYLEFYLATLDYLNSSMEMGFDSMMFEDIIEDCDTEMEQNLKEAAHRLSRHASGTLKIALETFDFDILGGPSFFDDDFDPFDDDFDDDFDPFDDDFDDDFDPFDDDFDDDLPTGMPFPDFNMPPEEFFSMLNDDHVILKTLFESIRNKLETRIDEQELRGASKAVLMGEKNNIMADPEFDEIGQLIKTLFKTVFKNKKKFRLSKEAKTIFLD